MKLLFYLLNLLKIFAFQDETLYICREKFEIMLFATDIETIKGRNSRISRIYTIEVIKDSTEVNSEVR